MKQDALTKKVLKIGKYKCLKIEGDLFLEEESLAWHMAGDGEQCITIHN